MQNMKITHLLLGLAALTFYSNASAAIYKQVDEHGNVTYSDSPNPDAAKEKTLDIPNNVNTIETGKSQQQFENEFKQSVEADKNSLHKSWEAYDKALKKAQAKLDEASMELEDAKIFGEGDRVFTKTGSGGFSRETPQYKERVSAAEARYTEAVNNLESAKKTKPNQRRPDMTPSAFENTPNAPQ